MSGFIPTPAEGWPLFAEYLETALRLGAGPWPEPAVVTDLRWHIDQHALTLRQQGVESPTPAQLLEGKPGRPSCIKRWGWKDNKVRKYLDDPSLWWDAKRWGMVDSVNGRQPSASDSPVTRQRVASESPAAERSNANNLEGFASGSPAVRQPPASESPASRQAAPESKPPTAVILPLTLHPTPSPSPSPSPKTQEGVSASNEAGQGLVIAASTKRSADFAEVLRVWNTEAVLEVRKRGGTVSEHPRITPSSSLGKVIRQRLDQEGLDRVLVVIRWYATADDPRAKFLREGGYELDTLLGAKKFTTYFAKANASKSAKPLTGKHAHDPAPTPPPEPVLDAAAKAEARARFEAVMKANEERQAKLLRRQQGGT